MAVASRHFQEIVGPWPLLLSALFYGRTSSSPVGRNGKLSSDCPELALTTDYCYEHHFVCSRGSRLPLSMTPDISRSSSVGSSTQLPLSKKTVEGPMTSDLKNVYLCNLSSGLCGAGYRCGNLGSLHQAKNFILVIKYLKQEGEDGVVTEQRSAPGGGDLICVAITSARTSMPGKCWKYVCDSNTACAREFTPLLYLLLRSAIQNRPQEMQFSWSKVSEHHLFS